MSRRRTHGVPARGTIRRTVMGRWMLAILPAILVCACSGESGDSGRSPEEAALAAMLAPGISLQRIGTIGDYPPTDQTTVVNVDAEGVMTVDGREMDLGTLWKTLCLLADRERDAEPPYPSRWSVVLRLDRSLPWGGAQWLVSICAHPDVRISRIHFAVLPEDEASKEEGTLATHLPLDRGLAATPERIDERVPVRPCIYSTGPGSDPAEVFARARERFALEPDIPGEVAADAFVPTGYVLRVIDILHRAGARGVTFAGKPPPWWSGALTWLVQDARRSKVNPTIDLLHEMLDGDPGAASSLPPVVRVRGGFAGAAEERVEDISLHPSDCEGREPVPAPPAAPPGPVEKALEWLAAHQCPKGSWDCDGFESQCLLNKCGGSGSADHDVGVIGLALLALLDTGHTHKRGKHKKTVRLGLKHLKRIQDDEGCFGPRTSARFLYDHAVATQAMCEAYAQTGSPLFKRPAQCGINFLGKCRNPDLAWRYGHRPGDNDTSVTAWAVLALTAAKYAGKLRVPEGALKGARAWIEKVTDPETGRVGYTARGTGPDRTPNQAKMFPPDRSEALTAMGMMIRIYCGEDPENSEMIRKGAELCATVVPRWDVAAGTIDMDYWYFGTIALFHVGGEPWQAWKGAMQAAIVERQCAEGDRWGSWDPVGPWGGEGGRVYSTALMTLCVLMRDFRGGWHPPPRRPPTGR
jgi:hypothetical protein